MWSMKEVVDGFLSASHLIKWAQSVVANIADCFMLLCLLCGHGYYTWLYADCTRAKCKRGWLWGHEIDDSPMTSWACSQGFSGGTNSSMIRLSRLEQQVLLVPQKAAYLIGSTCFPVEGTLTGSRSVLLKLSGNSITACPLPAIM